MKKKDFILIAIVLFAAMILYLFFYDNKEGNYVKIEINGKLYNTYSINKNQTIEIDNQYGHNIVEIEDGKVYMLEADCEDGYCKSQGRISNNKQTIVCLPHKLVIEVVIKKNNTKNEEQNNDIDAIAK